jgi:transposase InsO family protein
VELHAPLKRVCDVLGAPRSTVYARWRRDGISPERRGPRCELDDDQLVKLVRRVLKASPFSGEGYRKVRARLRREHEVHVGGKRVLRLMRREGLLAPQRAARRRSPRLHVGSIVPGAPNLRWGTDATLAWTRDDGWVWIFALVDHFTAEAWCHVAKTGDRFAALQPLYDAVIDRFGQLGPDVARGITVRHDWGSQYRSHHFTGSLRWLGMTDEPTYPGEPEGNGCAERWIRTLKEQCLWVRLHDDLDDLRHAVADFVELYNNQWLIQRHGHHTPKEAYAAATISVAA